ncbi:hypothetical protein Tco_0353698 [Tanacetum coccineum]
MVACLEKTAGNSEFHEIVDFLTSSLIHHALTVSPTIYISYIEQFWNTASSQTVNDEKQIHATVDSKAVVVTEASIRSSLLLNDADGTACLTNEAIFQNLALMGYEGELNKLTFQKALFSPQWKYLIHTILHCLSSKSTSWNEFSTNIASAVICLATNQKFNFSKLIFDGMLRNLDNPKKKFLMYPRFLMVFLNNQIELGEPFNDVYITPAHTLKVFSNMSRKGLKFSRKVTPLFDSMLVPHQAPEGEGSEQPTEPQPTPSPTQPSIGDQPLVTDSSSSHDTTQDSRDSLEGTNGSEGDQVQPSHDSHLSGGPTSDKAKGGMTLEELSIICTNLSNKVLALEAYKDAQAANIIKLKTRIKKLKKKSLPVISHHRVWLRSVSRLSMKRKLGRKESVSKQGRKNAKPKPTLDDSTFDYLDADHGMDYMDIEEPVSAAGNTEVSTAGVNTAVPNDKTKLKGVAIKEVKESDRPERSILTLKPLPSIDPKDKGKGVLKESPIKKVKRSDLDAAKIAKDAKVARLVYEEELAELEKEKGGKTEIRTSICGLHCKFALYIKEQERAANFVPIGSEKDERMIENMNKKATDVDEEEVLEEPDSTKVEDKQEGNTESTRKRPDRRLKMKATKKSKRQKTDFDLEEEEQLKAFLMIVPNEEGEIDYDVLDKRADGSSRYIKTFTKMVSRFDRLDFIKLHSLAMKRFETSTPEGIDLILWGSLRTIVHILVLEDGTEFYMLAERRYPLIKETLERMLALRLIAESESEVVFDLLRFIQKQIDESGSHDGIYQKLYGNQLTMLHSKELASPKQMALGKDISNLLIVDSLLKTIWLSMHHVIAIKHWLFQNKRLLGRIVGFQKFLQLSAATYTSYYCLFYLVLLVKNAKDSRK